MTFRPLDAQTRTVMEPRFGHDFSRVRIRVDAESTRDHDAIAFTSGEDITFAPGQYRPETSRGRRLLAHELAHVVQQDGQGSGVRTVNVATNRSRPGDVVERAADHAAQAFGGREDPHVSTALRVRDQLRASRTSNNHVLRIATWAGDITADTYKAIKDVGGSSIGADITLRFHPGKVVDATHIGMVQMVNSQDLGKVIALDKTVAARSIPAGKAGAGGHIDQDKGHANPLYVAGAPGAKDRLADTPADLSGGPGFFGQYGWHFTDKAGKLQSKDATLKDQPKLPGHGANASQVFETTPLAVAGAQIGTYYGSVRWGWRSDAANKFALIPLSRVSNDVPSATFARAASQWATVTAVGGIKDIPLPATRGKFAAAATNLVLDPNKAATSVIGSIDKNTRLEVTLLGTTMPFNKGAKDPWRRVTVVEGTLIGRVGWVLASALSDTKK